MVANREAPARGSATTATSLRRRTRGGGGGGNVGEGARVTNTILQFYTDVAAGRRMSTNTVLNMGIGFVVVSMLHVFGKPYRH